ncbi:MAG: site-2 protease family protein [Anaerolineales bacterium]|nr:site-2 protease family protein [Anaerolineales bacterium]
MSINILSILEFVAVLAFLIIVHELGHFLVARLLKIDVEEFGIGFPPRALTLFEALGTKFTLNWLPFGGYVRLKGENDPTIPGSFAAANPWKRIAVLLAGSFMNLLVAVILYTVIITMIGMPDLTKVEIKGIAPDSPADLAGLQVGDLILRVNDEEINSTDELSQVVTTNLGKEITIVIQRETQEGQVSLVPRVSPPPEEGAIGIIMGNPTNPINPLVALPYGVVATYEHSRALLSFVGQLIRGETNAEDGRVVGLKGMLDLYEEARESEPIAGIPSIVNVMGFITNIAVSLGLLNLLPFPALDGGRILFALPEIIIRRRIPPQYEAWVNLVGFAILILLLIYINLQDFINPIANP